MDAPVVVSSDVFNTAAVAAVCLDLGIKSAYVQHEHGSAVVVTTVLVAHVHDRPFAGVILQLLFREGLVWG